MVSAILLERAQRLAVRFFQFRRRSAFLISDGEHMGEVA